MSERQAGPYDSNARRWLALAERRKAHFVELCESGRWKHYYKHSDLEGERRKIEFVCDRWAAIVGLVPRTGGLAR
jgi:hypothetical protein